MKIKIIAFAGFLAAGLLCLSAPARGAAPADGTISGYCFSDDNKNRKMDSGEQGIAGITVTLVKRNFFFFKQEVASAVTDAGGQFVFSGLEPGIYGVKSGLAPAYRSLGLNPRAAVLWGQKMHKDLSFGLVRRMQHITISGKVYLAPQMGGSVSAADGAKIRVSTDADGNGRIDLREQEFATADSNGFYTIKAPVAAGMQSLVRFSVEGYAPLLKTLQINTPRAITGFDGTLVQMDDLAEGESGKWRNQSGSVQISSSSIGGGSVRHFNPATEADKFPGSFSDNAGNLLISGVFTAFELEDADGKRMATTAPGDPARIRMRLPRDTWGAVIDTAAGTGRIDVPMYYFDEETGQWVRGKTELGEDLSGWLEQDNGDIIAEAQLAAIRAGTFAGEIFSASDVTHFSYWNVDWPVESHACLSGTLLDEDGEPVAAATITVQGATYTGTATPQATDENGKFCVDVMRSEGPGEDVNQNGITGETQKVLISGSSSGRLYDFGEHEVPAQSGTCPAGCLEVDLTASAENEVQVALCEVSGTALLEGVPTPSVAVYGYDDMVDSFEVCGTAGCSFFGSTSDTGAFSLTAPVALRLTLMGYFFEQTIDPEGSFVYMSQQTIAGCPADPVNFNVEFMYCMVNSPLISLAGTTISWNPDIALSALFVTGYMGQRWALVANGEEGFTGPITYGTVPAGAQQVWPLAGGSPAALSQGDMIMVFPLGGYVPAHGRQCYSSSVYAVE